MVSTRAMTAVVVFGREPVAGRVKTRLAAAIGDAAAARIYAVLLDHTLGQVRNCDTHAVLSVSDPPSSGWRPSLGIPVEVQPAGDLGKRLVSAFERRFSEGFERVVVVGSDIPGLTTAMVTAALGRLTTYQAAVGPSRDGGYWLIGQRHPGADLFSDVPWSSLQTLEATRQRIRELGLSLVELAVLEDVDTRTDLEAVLASGKLATDLILRIDQAWRDVP